MSTCLLEISPLVWGDLISHLRTQGSGIRESGAFLLGNKSPSTRTVVQFLPYEQLQEDSLHDDYVELTAASFAKLWRICREQNLAVVADIHTHRFGAQQSLSDSTNPMIAIAGHIALIVPRFAQGAVGSRDIGLYVYQGSHRWISFSGAGVERAVHLKEVIDGNH